MRRRTGRRRVARHANSRRLEYSPEESAAPFKLAQTRQRPRYLCIGEKPVFHTDRLVRFQEGRPRCRHSVPSALKNATRALGTCQLHSTDKWALTAESSGAPEPRKRRCRSFCPSMLRSRDGKAANRRGHLFQYGDRRQGQSEHRHDRTDLGCRKVIRTIDQTTAEE
jgi:hypothetical protein